MKVDIQPRNDLVLIERLDDVPKSAIVIPEVAKERGLKGKVLAVGPGKLIEGINGGLVRKPVEVKPGDIVYFNSKWNEFSGSHFAGEEMIGTPSGLHLIYEGDIFLKENPNITRWDVLKGYPDPDVPQRPTDVKKITNIGS